jgi:hypothetical protein
MAWQMTELLVDGDTSDKLFKVTVEQRRTGDDHLPAAPLRRRITESRDLISKRLVFTFDHYSATMENTDSRESTNAFETSEFLNKVGIVALQAGLYSDACEVFSDAVQAVRDETIGFYTTSVETRCGRNKHRLKKSLDLLKRIETTKVEDL